MKKYKKLITAVLMVALVAFGVSLTSHANSHNRVMTAMQTDNRSSSVTTNSHYQKDDDKKADEPIVSYEKWYFDWSKELCYTESGETFHLGGGVRTAGDSEVYMYAENIYNGYKIIAEVNQTDWNANIASFSMKNGCYQYVSGNDSIVINVEKL